MTVFSLKINFYREYDTFSKYSGIQLYSATKLITNFFISLRC